MVHKKTFVPLRQKNRWVLNVDADETISLQCAVAVQKLLLNEPEFSVYRFPRKNFIADRWVRYAGWYPDLISRLYDKNRVSFSESMVHERLMPDENAGVIDHPISHYSFDGLEDYVERQNRYSSVYAEEKKTTWLGGKLDTSIFKAGLGIYKNLFYQARF
jgi:hypothetical protein